VTDGGYTIAHERDGLGVALIRLAGEFDLNNSDALANALTVTVSDPGVVQIRVDMGGTTFMDSSAIRAVALAYEAAQDRGKPLALVNVQHSVRRIFEIVELAHLIADD
jgi:anti-anti-sigma factor